MKIGNRLLCAFLSILILFSLTPLSAFAESGFDAALVSAAKAVGGHISDAEESDGAEASDVPEGASLSDDSLSPEDAPADALPGEGAEDEVAEEDVPAEDEVAEEDVPAEDEVGEEAVPAGDEVGEEDVPAEESEALLSLRALIASLPSADEIAGMGEEELASLDELVSRILEAYDLLSEEEQDLVDLSPLEAFTAALGAQPLADASEEPSFTVTITPDSPVYEGTGGDVTLTIIPDDSSRNYQFYFGDILVNVDGSWNYDTYYSSGYSNNNTFVYHYTAPGEYRIKVGIGDFSITPAYTKNENVYFTIRGDDSYSIEALAQKVVDECEANSFQTQYEKALFYHDWLINNVEYSTSYAGAYSVFTRGISNCQGYHDAFKMLLAGSGIMTDDLYLEHHKVADATGNGHIWTRVCLDGEWTLIDVTWDDTYDPYLTHMYFGLTDELMQRAHPEHVSEYYSCDSLERNYMIRSGAITAMSDPIKDEILAHAAGTYTIPASTGNNVADVYYKILCPLVAYYLENHEPALQNSSVKVSYDPDSKTYSVTHCPNHNSDTSIPAVAATCTKAGLTEGKKCSVCGEVTVPQQAAPRKDHSLKTIPAVAATCTKAGLTEGKKCSVCGEVTVPQQTAPSKGHTLIAIPAVAATCTKAGLTEGKKCSVCGEVTVPQQTVPRKDHSLKTIPAVAATCAKTGLTAGKKCSVCGEITVPQQTVPRKDHSLKTIPAVAATCAKTGLTEGKKCSVCGEITVPQQTVPRKAHSPVVDPAVAPSGSAPGKTEGSHCSVCGKTLVAQKEYFSDTVLVLPADELSGREFWVDGRLLAASAVTEQGGELRIELGRSDATNLVTYTYNKSGADPHEIYPVGMKVWMLENSGSGYTAKYIPAFDDLLKYAGSSIRITGVKGIRMITGLRQEVKSALIGGGLEGYTLLEYGTVLGQASKVSASSLVLGDPNAKSNFAYKRGVADPVFASGGGMVQYTNVLVGFNDEQCKEDIVMRPYIVLRSPDGRDVTVYGGVVQRSIGYIAYQNRSVFSPGSGAYNYVWDIIHNVYGDQYDSDREA